MLVNSYVWQRGVRALQMPSKQLQSFHMRLLRKILGIKWWHRLTDMEVNRRSGLKPFQVLLAQRQLRWVGHTIRMPEYRLPRQMLYGKLAEGSRHRGGPCKRYRDHIKATLKLCNIPSDSLQAVATDRAQWRTACEADLVT